MICWSIPTMTTVEMRGRRRLTVSLERDRILILLGLTSQATRADRVNCSGSPRLGVWNGKRKPDIGDGRPGAENHGPDVDGRSSSAEPGDDEQYARGPFRGDPEEPQGHGPGRHGPEERYAAR